MEDRKDSSIVTGKIIMVDRTFRSVVVFKLLEEDGIVIWTMIAPHELCRELINALNERKKVQVEYYKVDNSKFNINFEAFDVIDVPPKE